MSQPTLEDHVMVEVVARAGGYEAVEANSQWGKVAKTCGLKKTQANKIKERYEEMLRYTAEAEQVEETIEDNYEVESILDSKVVSGKTVYLVQWKGYDEDGSDAQPTWEPAANLEGAREIVRDYEAKRRAAAERPAREGGGEWGGKRAREGGAPTSSDMCKVLRIKKPPTGEDLKDSELFFEVLCADGSILERISEKVLTAELYTCKLLYSFMRQRLSFF